MQMCTLSVIYQLALALNLVGHNGCGLINSGGLQAGRGLWLLGLCSSKCHNNRTALRI